MHEMLPPVPITCTSGRSARSANSVRLDVRGADYLRPALHLGSEERAELLRRPTCRLGALLRELRADVACLEYLIHVSVDAFDERWRDRSRRDHAVPRVRFES